jgi:hypothetical protein
MGYYLRYLITDDRAISLEQIHRGLERIDSAYSITPDGDLKYGIDVYGEIELNSPSDGLFDEEIAEFKDELGFMPQSVAKTKVVDILNRTNTIVAVRVLWGGRPTEQTLVRLSPLWAWLFANYEGVLYADVEGYYGADKPLLVFKD